MEELINNYYLGYYQKVISDGSLMKKPVPEIEFMLLKSRIALGQIDFVISTTKAEDSNVKKALSLLSRFLKSKDASLIESLDNNLTKDPYYAICVSIILMNLERYLDALKILRGIKHSEAGALRVQSYLSLGLIDRAEAELPSIDNEIQNILSSAAVSLYQNTDSVSEVLSKLLDTADSCGQSLLIQNTIAVCRFALSEWDTAYGEIQTCSTQNPQDESTEINMAVAMNQVADFNSFETQVDLVVSKNNNM